MNDKPEAYGPRLLTWVNSCKSLIQHFSTSVALCNSNKKHLFLEAHAMSISEKLSFISHIAFEKLIFYYFFGNLAFRLP